MATDFYVLLNCLITLTFDDRNITVNQHVTNYKRICNTFVSVISRADINNDRFGKGLRGSSTSKKANVEFLLKPFPQDYSNTIETIQSQDNYGYDNTA
jgi:hypothetical protein